jgi:uncharacterized membrane protein YgdD (TMEM256/DUF423 family)
MNATSELHPAASKERLAAFVCLLAVTLGAMGAHALKDKLGATPTGLENWKTAALYHLVHGVVLYFLASKGRPIAWWLIFAGILGFSGSLYAYSLTQIKTLAMITPFGGGLLIAGWAVLVGCSCRKS